LFSCENASRCILAVGRKRLVECGLMSEIVCLLADDTFGAELQETVLDLLASLCDAGKCHIYLLRLVDHSVTV